VHESTLVVLLLLMFGQILMLSFGVFVLWLAGEIGNVSEQSESLSRQPRIQADEASIAGGADSAALSDENCETLAQVEHELPIQPPAANDESTRRKRVSMK
jgi:hypothetical protein